MAKQVRIDALANDCGVAPREVLRVLIDLGQFRYTRFNQQISEELAVQVRERLCPTPAPAAPRAKSDDLDLFARAMNAAGVQRLDTAPRALKDRPKPRPGKKPAKGGKATPVRGAVAAALVPSPPQDVLPVVPTSAPEVPSPPAPAPEDARLGSPAPVASPPVEPPAPTAAPPAPEQPVPPAPVVAPPTVDESQLASLRGEVERLAGVYGEALAERDALRAERDELQRTAERAALTAGPDADGVALAALLQARGLRGVDEASFALRALLAAHLLDSSLPLFRVQDPVRVERVLRDRLCLHCGHDGCAPPAGVELARVPRQRCELCGGEDLPRIHRRFSDACLLSGITRVLLVGGRRWQQAWIEAGLDRRVAGRFWAGDRPPVPEALEADLAWAQLVLVWEDGILVPGLTEAVASRRERALVRLAAESAGALMVVGVQRIEQLDPSELP